MPAPLSFVDLEGILTGMRMLACVSFWHKLFLSYVILKPDLSDQLPREEGRAGLPVLPCPHHSPGQPLHADRVLLDPREAELPLTKSCVF